MSDKDSILDKLRQVHDFPGPYMFKVIGPNDAEFLATAVQSVINAIGPGADPDVVTRESSGGKHVSITMTVDVASAEVVLDVYDLLRTLEGAKFVL